MWRAAPRRPSAPVGPRPDAARALVPEPRIIVMPFDSWLEVVARSWSRRSKRGRRTPSRTARPGLEALEPRLAPVSSFLSLDGSGNLTVTDVTRPDDVFNGRADPNNDLLIQSDTAN